MAAVSAHLQWLLVRHRCCSAAAAAAAVVAITAASAPPVGAAAVLDRERGTARNRQPEKIDQKLGFSPVLPAYRCLAAPPLEG